WFFVSRVYTLSLNELSILRKDLAAWRSRDFTDDELKGFDLETIIGHACLLNVAHENRNGETYANVTAVMKLPKGMTAPQRGEYIRSKDRTPKDPDTAADQEAEADRFMPSDEDVPF